MYYGSGTADRSASGQPADDAAHALGRCCMCTHQMATLLCEMNDIMATILKV